MQETGVVIPEGACQEFVDLSFQLGFHIAIEKLTRLLLDVPVLHVDGMLFLLVRVPIIE